MLARRGGKEYEWLIPPVRDGDEDKKKEDLDITLLFIFLLIVFLDFINFYFATIFL